MPVKSYSPTVPSVNAPLLLSAWCASTTLTIWRQYPPDVQKRTARAAAALPYKDTPRSRWEASQVSAHRKVVRK